MSIVKPVFWDYVTLDSDGCVDGIREDATEEAKKEYEKYVRKQEKNKALGIKE